MALRKKRLTSRNRKRRPETSIARPQWLTFDLAAVNWSQMIVVAAVLSLAFSGIFLSEILMNKHNIQK